MGLDQYAYVAAKQGQYSEYWESAEMDPVTKDFVSRTTTKPREIAYWRKHPNLQGWMESLWIKRMHEANKELPEDNGFGSSFNGIELELTIDDIDQLEKDVLANNLPSTSGFFFGDDSDDYYQEQDLKFIKQARAELFCGLKVFYNSSW